MSKEKGKPPVFKIRDQGLTVTVWEREHEGDLFHDVTYERSYKDRDEKWQTTHSVSAHQIPALRKLLDMAHTFILEATAE